jgi:mRNA interferase HicA
MLDLIKILQILGCELVRHSGKHDWYENKATGICQPIPRHNEINEHLAKSIIKKLT